MPTILSCQIQIVGVVVASDKCCRLRPCHVLRELLPRQLWAIEPGALVEARRGLLDALVEAAALAHLQTFELHRVGHSLKVPIVLPVPLCDVSRETFEQRAAVDHRLQLRAAELDVRARVDVKMHQAMASRDDVNDTVGRNHVARRVVWVVTRKVELVEREALNRMARDGSNACVREADAVAKGKPAKPAAFAVRNGEPRSRDRINAIPGSGFIFGWG